MKNGDCTVIVCSCDEYEDLQSPSVSLFRKFWPDCPFEVVLATETAATEGFDRVVSLGERALWCRRLEKALRLTDTPYVLLLMDDYLLAGPVDTVGFMRRLGQARSLDAANLRLNPNPPGRIPLPDVDLMEMPKNVAYCITCQTGIWNREFLLGLVERNGSAWELERKGSFMVGGETRPLLVTRTKEFPFIDAVHKGYWEKKGLELCRANGVDVDLAKRGLPPLSIRVKEGLKALIFAVVPTTLLVKVQNFLSSRGAGA